MRVKNLLFGHPNLSKFSCEMIQKGIIISLKIFLWKFSIDTFASVTTFNN